jgi:mannosyltransferase OCH1-like enzyme
MIRVYSKKDKIEITQNKIKALIKLKNIVNIPYPLKFYYNSIIPLNIYQTWHTKNVPPLMKKITNKIIMNNPKFKYFLFDDNDCRNFIKDNFSIDVLNAYDNLIPGAYKADLWRYCILYINGGIYLDIKYNPLNNFKFINLTEKEHWVLDMDKNGIYNALMVCLPKNPILLRAIEQIVLNTKNKFYGNNCLEPTGPQLLSKYFTQEDKNLFDCYHEVLFNDYNKRIIVFNNYIIFKSYNGYLNEHGEYKKVDHYSSLWAKKNIYN